MFCSNIAYNYDDELYYVFFNGKADPELIFKCLQKSNAFWHSLGILTTTNLDTSNNYCFTKQIITSICKDVQLFFVGGYDSESYILWERV